MFFYPLGEYAKRFYEQSRHLIHHDFGSEYGDRSDAWEAALNDPKFLAGDPDTARLRLLELYDDTYGIVLHDSDPSPFSLVSQVEQEDSLLLSGFEGYLDEYIHAGIKEFTGLSFETWMSYPYCKQKSILNVVCRHGANKNEHDSSKLNALEAALLKQVK